MIDSTFLVRLLVTFTVGGTIIALQSRLAERLPRHAGIIISIPTTLPLGLFFIGWIQGLDAAIEAVQVIPGALGLLFPFVWVFIRSSSWLIRHGLPSLLANFPALLVWLSGVVIVVRFYPSGLLAGSILYLLGFLFGLYFLRYRVPSGDAGSPLAFRWYHVLFRSIFAGLILSLAVFLSRTAGAFWGGVFSVFPAVALSSFNILLLRYSPTRLVQMGRSMPAGSIQFIVYSLAVPVFFPWGIVAGTIMCQLVSMLFIPVLLRLDRKD